MELEQAAYAVPALIAAGTALAGSVQTPPAPVPLTVHEWGTFTSVAGADGQAVRWVPQAVLVLEQPRLSPRPAATARVARRLRNMSRPVILPR